ncbi:AAA family ATPase [Treponema brennaborense]|uniref:ATPase associated with various cellular activities AAA_3 n=1 Tax=Treponema brennaborense (strain DSM 12168 / CIP 105900 / DD5/3) TaxID=906968 RepID=F4LK51_TREBD|nr:ATPase associated with various cellular activities AAA_3 [Treponema brennaborense DSM 12168]
MALMKEIDAADFEQCRQLLQDCRDEAAKRVVGQQAVIDGILTALVAGGHVLLEGVPGLAKTLAVKTFSDLSGLDFKRIQFTPDLLPADVAGTLIYEQGSGTFSVRKGPVFSNLVLADEINRAPAKVQSALLEAMAEKQVTIGERTYKLPDPFFVLATQNPIEQEGTYSLPEAELDRFLLKLQVSYPSAAEEVNIVRGGGNPETVPVKKVFSAEKLGNCRKLLEAVSCDDKIIEYIVSIVSVTRPAPVKNAPSAALKLGGARNIAAGAARAQDDIHRYISFGASPRASIALCRCAKAAALFAGRSFVLPEDVKAAAPAVLRHRLVLSYEAAADGVYADDLIAKILALMPVP